MAAAGGIEAQFWWSGYKARGQSGKKGKKMLTNYLEMIQSVERDRRPCSSDRVYTYGNLADLALEKQKQLHLENRKQQLAVIRESSILEQLVAFLACQGNLGSAAYCSKRHNGAGCFLR